MPFQPLREMVPQVEEMLDAYDPTWPDRIDTNTLDMEEGDCCILGQLEGEYIRGRDKLAEHHLGENASPWELHRVRALLDQALCGAGDVRKIWASTYNETWRKLIQRRQTRRR